MRRGLALACLSLACDPDVERLRPVHPEAPATERPAEPVPEAIPSPAAHRAASEPAPAEIRPVPEAIPAPAASAPAPSTPARGPLELAFVGDIILGKYVLHEYASLLGDDDPFAAVRDLLDVDVLVGNLETPLVRQLPAKSPIHIGYRFGADEVAAGALARAGFDALSVANNHATDLLGDGLRETPDILRGLGIAAVGAARTGDDPVRVVTVERAGWRIGLVAATTYVNTAAAPDDPTIPLYRTRDLPRRLLPHLAAARASHDLLLVLLHWGQEYMPDPDHFQRVTARQLLDGGADLVVGHHPHVLQGFERHAHGLVAYSLGNFLFANTDERSRRSGVLRVRYEPGRRCPVRASFHPVWLGPAPRHRPEPAGAPAPEILTQVRKASRRLGTAWRPEPTELVLTDFPACAAAPDK